MLRSPLMVSVRVPDMQNAREWYRRALGQEPVFAAPFATAFSTGGDSLLLLLSTSAEDERSVAYFNVDDIEAAYQHLLDAGATPRSEITFTMLRSRMARVVDPFGNVLGVISTAERAKTIESRPSESAMTVAFSRALAAHDDRDGLRGPDFIAEVFLGEEGKKALTDRVGREWILGKMAGTHEYFLARTRYLDNLFECSLRQAVPQIVLLGAGYDTRACRFRHLLGPTRIYELDVESTQRRKQTLLAEAGIEKPEPLVYVTINFEKQSIGEALAAAGFDRTQVTLFLWEGVTYYLTATAVDDALACVRSHAPAGSLIAFDYLIKAPDIASRYKAKEVLEAWRTAYTGEPVQFGIDEGTVADFLTRRGFEVVEHIEPPDQEQRLLRRHDGSLAGHVVALFGIVQARVA